MTKPQSPSVVEFKSNVDRIAEFLAAQGYDIKHMHLMEAVSRYEGSRDWRTFKAQLEEKETPKLAVPDLGGKSLTAFFSVKPNESGYNPDFAAIEVDQKWVNRLYELRQVSEDQGIALNDENMAPHWLDNNGDWRTSNEGLTVRSDCFWVFGYEKYSGKFETEERDIDGFMNGVLDALSEGTQELFYLENDFEEADKLQDQVAGDYSEVAQRLRDILIPEAKDAALSCVLQSWGDLSYEEVYDILENGDASRRSLLVVKPGKEGPRANSDLTLAAWLQMHFVL